MTQIPEAHCAVGPGDGKTVGRQSRLFLELLLFLLVTCVRFSPGDVSSGTSVCLDNQPCKSPDLPTPARWRGRV